MTITNASDYTDGRPGRRCRLSYSHITSLTTPPPAQHEAKWRALRTFRAAATYSRRHDGRELSATLTFDGDAAPTFRLALGPWGGVTCKRIDHAANAAAATIIADVDRLVADHPVICVEALYISGQPVDLQRARP